MSENSSPRREEEEERSRRSKKEKKEKKAKKEKKSGSVLGKSSKKTSNAPTESGASPVGSESGDSEGRSPKRLSDSFKRVLSGGSHVKRQSSGSKVQAKAEAPMECSPPVLRVTDYTAKLCLLGDSGVGKTQLLARFAQKKFSEDSKTTVGVEFSDVQESYEGKSTSFRIWDTAGQERFRSIIATYYRSSNGLVVVYDVTKGESFAHVAGWISEAQEKCGSADPLQQPLVMVVGNKSDLPALVDEQAVSEWCRERNYHFFVVSAKTGTGVDRAFKEFLQHVYEQRIRPPAPPVPSLSLSSRGKDRKADAPSSEGAREIQPAPSPLSDSRRSARRTSTREREVTNAAVAPPESKVLKLTAEGAGEGVKSEPAKGSSCGC